MFQDSWLENGTKVTATWIAGNDYHKFLPYFQVFGVLFTKDGKVLITFQKEWIIPGGKPEKGESPEETLKREVTEECSVEVEKAKLIGAFLINHPNNPKKELGDNYYQLRYAGIIKSIGELKVDPAEGKIHERKFIAPEEWADYVKWGDVGKEMFRAAWEWFKK